MAFNLCMAAYLYGDLAIYVTAVAKSGKPTKNKKITFLSNGILPDVILVDIYRKNAQLIFFPNKNLEVAVIYV